MNEIRIPLVVQARADFSQVASAWNRDTDQLKQRLADLGTQNDTAAMRSVMNTIRSREQAARVLGIGFNEPNLVNPSQPVGAMSFRNEQRMERMLGSAVGIRGGEVGQVVNTYQYLEHFADRMGTTVGGLAMKFGPMVGALGLAGGATHLLLKEMEGIGGMGARELDAAGHSAAGFFKNFAVGMGWIEVTNTGLRKTADIVEYLGSTYERQSRTISRRAEDEGRSYTPYSVGVSRGQEDIESHRKLASKFATAEATRLEELGKSIETMSASELAKTYTEFTGNDTDWLMRAGMFVDKHTLGMTAEKIKEALNVKIKEYQTMLKGTDAAALKAAEELRPKLAAADLANPRWMKNATPKDIAEAQAAVMPAGSDDFGKSWLTSGALEIQDLYRKLQGDKNLNPRFRSLSRMFEKQLLPGSTGALDIEAEEEAKQPGIDRKERLKVERIGGNINFADELFDRWESKNGGKRSDETEGEFTARGTSETRRLTERLELRATLMFSEQQRARSSWAALAEQGDRHLADMPEAGTAKQYQDAAAASQRDASLDVLRQMAQQQTEHLQTLRDIRQILAQGISE